MTATTTAADIAAELEARDTIYVICLGRRGRKVETVVGMMFSAGNEGLAWWHAKRLQGAAVTYAAANQEQRDAIIRDRLRRIELFGA